MQFCGALGLDTIMHDSKVAELSNSLDNGLSSRGASGVVSTSIQNTSQQSAIVQLELSIPLRLLFVLYIDGQLLLCSVSKKGLRQAESIKAERRLGSGDSVCASIASEQQILAVGTRRGVVELYDLAESASLIRTVSLYDWG